MKEKTVKNWLVRTCVPAYQDIVVSAKNKRVAIKKALSSPPVLKDGYEGFEFCGVTVNPENSTEFEPMATGVAPNFKVRLWVVENHSIVLRAKTAENAIQHAFRRTDPSKWDVSDLKENWIGVGEGKYCEPWADDRGMNEKE